MMKPSPMPCIKLSYDIDEDSPHFPSARPPERIQRSSIGKGDASNSLSVTLYTHYGTHVDAPYHFIQDGLKITDLDVNQFYFKKPLTIDIPKEGDQPIKQEDLERFEKEILGKDLLLLRTGFSKYRHDHGKYLSNPYIAVDAAHYLIDRFPELRGLGIDFISALNLKFRPIGIEAHQILLGGSPQKRFLLLFEDLHLDFGDRTLSEVFGLPLFVKDAEAFPCTIIAR